MPESNVLFTKTGHIARITLNRPRAANRINAQLAQEMAEICESIAQDDDIYAVILMGAGGKAFCEGSEAPGTDIPEMLDGIDQPIICALNGGALDEGLEIALACDIRLAAESAVFGLSQVSAGGMPSSGGTQRLPRLIGKGKALELALTGDKITAAEAYEIGLVSKVVPAGKALEEAEALAQKLAAQAPISLRFVKEAVHKGLDMTLEQGLGLEGDLYMLLHTTEDRTEGIHAFQEKRKPQFKGK